MHTAPPSPLLPGKDNTNKTEERDLDPQIRVAFASNLLQRNAIAPVPAMSKCIVAIVINK